MNVLLLENIDSAAVKVLSENGFNVESFPHTLSQNELITKINNDNISIIGIRSKTKLNETVLRSCSSLEIIGCFCIGTDQVNLKVATELGLAVFNSPFESTRSVAELTLANIIGLSRQLCKKTYELQNGYWSKTAKGMYEVRGKRLGIIGYGHVGSQLSILAENIGIKVYYYDIRKIMPLGNSKVFNSLEELLAKCDFISLHVPLTPDTENMIGEKEINMMKKGSYLLNLSRGKVLDIEATQRALKSGHLAGVALDVYPVEPKTNNVYIDLPMGIQKIGSSDNIILTPHIGGATVEAQRNIGIDVSYKIMNYFTNGDTSICVNLPTMLGRSIGIGQTLIIYLHKNVPGILSNVNRVLQKYNININNLNLTTKDNLGYCLIRIDKQSDNTKKIIQDEINNFSETIRLRFR